MHTKVIPVEPGHRIQLPADWAGELGLDQLVTVEKTATGIIVRPGPRRSWDDVFATRLVVGGAEATEANDLQVTGDDLVY
jgi:hypothetical protein